MAANRSDRSDTSQTGQAGQTGTRPLQSSSGTGLGSTPAEALLVAITGDTYPLREQLKAMGAVWDSVDRVWKIAPERAAQTQALVDHRPAGPTPAAASVAAPAAARPRTPAGTYQEEPYQDEIDPLADLADPFEESEPPTPAVALSGNTYPVKEALKALGARWDKDQRAWLIAANKVDHARAIIDNQGTQGTQGS